MGRVSGFFDKIRTRSGPTSGFFKKTHTRPYSLSDRVKSGPLGSGRAGYPRVGFKLPSLAFWAFLKSSMLCTVHWP